MKKKVLKIVVASLLALVIVLGGGFGVYAHDYYHPNQYALSAIDEENNKNYKEDHNLVFKPAGKIKAGFVFYPGGKVDYRSYAPLMQRLANKGILCVIVHMPFNLAVFNSAGASKVLEDYKDIGTWYIGGHSLGGVMAASYASKHQDDFKGLIFLASYTTSSFKDSSMTSLSLRGSHDKVLKMEGYNKNKKNLPEESKEVVIEGGNHGYFGCYGKQSGDGTPTITNKKQLDLTAQYINDYIG